MNVDIYPGYLESEQNWQITLARIHINIDCNRLQQQSLLIGKEKQND